MILKMNHLHGQNAAAGAQEVVGAIYSLLEDGQIDPNEFGRLQIVLDWIEYEYNFREVVTTTQVHNARGETEPVMDVHVDTRQVVPGCLRAEILRSLSRANIEMPDLVQDRLPLEDFQAPRTSILWQFNRLYWNRLKDWEDVPNASFEPTRTDGSDGSQPQAIADAVGDFWTLLRDCDAKKQLPQEIFLLEIGRGTATRCGLWLDKFRELDQRRKTNYYPKLRVLVGDYSAAALEISRSAIKGHADLCSFVVLDALNPLKDLSHLRHKIFRVHLTNVYDNLPDEEMVQRDGHLYFVQVRAYIPMPEVTRIAVEFARPAEEIRSVVDHILDGGLDDFGSRARGVALWQQIWKAIRLEERLIPLEDILDFAFPEGLDAAKLEAILEEAPGDFRFHLSSGAMASFLNTLPLLHPRGYVQAQDCFVTELAQYRMGFYGPGKLSGSVLNWVNGALLREVAERAGYDVHFAPFHYRKESRSSILYTTRRE